MNNIISGHAPEDSQVHTQLDYDPRASVPSCNVPWCSQSTSSNTDASTSGTLRPQVGTFYSGHQVFLYLGLYIWFWILKFCLIFRYMFCVCLLTSWKYCGNKCLHFNMLSFGFSLFCRSINKSKSTIFEKGKHSCIWVWFVTQLPWYHLNKQSFNVTEVIINLTSILILTLSTNSKVDFQFKVVVYHNKYTGAVVKINNR